MVVTRDFMLPLTSLAFLVRDSFIAGSPEPWSPPTLSWQLWGQRLHSLLFPGTQIYIFPLMPVDRAVAGHVQGQSQHPSLPFSPREALAQMTGATWGSSGWPGHVGSTGVLSIPL